MTFPDLFNAIPLITVHTDEGAVSLSPDAPGVWQADGIEVHAAADESGTRLPIRLRAAGHAVRWVHVRWNLPVPQDTRVLGDHWERGYGDLEWRGIVPERRLPWYFLAHSGGATHGIGVETGSAAGASAHFRVDNAGVSLWLDTACGGRGVRLGDRTLSAATVLVRRGTGGESPHEAARAFCRLLCPSPRLPKRPVYGGNDWYYAYGHNSANSIRRDAALIAAHAPDGPNRPFMVIDAGWFPAAGCDGGPYDVGNNKFPDMAGLAADIKAMGVRPGIWIRPLLRAADQTPDHWRLPSTHPLAKTGKREAYLDPTVPAVQAQIHADIARCTDWGYELIKHDFTTFDLTGRWGFEMNDGALSAPGDWGFAEGSQTTAEVTRALYQTIRAAAGDDTLLIGCNTIGHLGAGLFELQRTGDDTSGRDWDRTRRMGINTLAFRQAQHDTFFAVDADCVGLTDAIPWSLNRQWLDLLARSGTPLFVSADPDAVGPEQSAALKEAFARAATVQPAAEPLDWFDTVCPSRWRFGGAGSDEVTYDWYDPTGLPREGK